VLGFGQWGAGGIEEGNEAVPPLRPSISHQQQQQQQQPEKRGMPAGGAAAAAAAAAAATTTLQGGREGGGEGGGMPGLEWTTMMEQGGEQADLALDFLSDRLFQE